MVSEKDFKQLLKDLDVLRSVYAGKCDFDGAMYCRTARDVLNEQARRIAALESQLAAQASAVEELIQAGQLLSCALSYFQNVPNLPASAHHGNSIAERKWREALAALVNDQSAKEEGK